MCVYIQNKKKKKEIVLNPTSGKLEAFRADEACPYIDEDMRIIRGANSNRYRARLIDPATDTQEDIIMSTKCQDEWQ